jgi:hypothetical protein
MGYAQEASLISGLQSAVTEWQWRALFGQAVHGAAGCLLTRAFLLSVFRGMPEVRVMTLGSGAGFWALALRRVLGDRFRYTAWYEAHPVARAAHSALWGELNHHPTWFEWAHIVSSAVAADAALISLTCAAHSSANRDATEEDRDAVCAELFGAIRVAMRASPRVLVVEQTASILRPSMVTAFRRYTNVMLHFRGYAWFWIRCCPFVHLDVPIRKNRVFFFGILGS